MNPEEANPRRQAQMKRLSKFLSLLLRHRPSRFPIALDESGYADLNEVLRILHGLPNFRWATRPDVEAVCESSGRQRFELAGDRIRALYGHTAIRPSYPLVVPPPQLYHGTAQERLALILQEGIRPMERQYVHLAATSALARTIAIRHTPDPIILTVAAEAAYAAGISFYQPIPEIYLSDTIPPDYISTEGLP
jgi:putative RNA 2'-phosphotransferase